MRQPRIRSKGRIVHATVIRPRPISSSCAVISSKIASHPTLIPACAGVVWGGKLPLKWPRPAVRRSAALSRRVSEENRTFVGRGACNRPARSHRGAGGISAIVVARTHRGGPRQRRAGRLDGMMAAAMSNGELQNFNREYRRAGRRLRPGGCRFRPITPRSPTRRHDRRSRRAR
jgi:hypothetical protein